MLRVGMIKQASAGIYSWLPLGFKVMKKIEDIVRQEQNKIGAQEILMPTIQSSEIWKESGRYDDYGEEMLRITDRQLSNINIIVQKGLAAANEIFDQLDQQNEDNSGNLETKILGNIEFKNVSFSYDTGGLIIDDISFKIDKNETIAIVGKSGSGKSTIANLIPRFYNHSSGDVLIDGVSVNDYSLQHLRSSISIVCLLYTSPSPRDRG